MKESDNDDHPHYDDLIRELHELKRFIESSGEQVATGSGESDFGVKQAEREIPAPVVAPSSAAAPAAIQDDGEPPTLRQVVRRNQGDGTQQLDLLSVLPDVADREPQSRARPTSDEPADEAFGAAPDSVQPGESLDPHDGARDADDATADDEVREFVYDLSDRILGTIEDRLLERSGELLPDDLRRDLRESIGDLLYEWCER